MEEKVNREGHDILGNREIRISGVKSSAFTKDFSSLSRTPLEVYSCINLSTIKLIALEK